MMHRFIQKTSFIRQLSVAMVFVVLFLVFEVWVFRFYSDNFLTVLSKMKDSNELLDISSEISDSLDTSADFLVRVSPGQSAVDLQELFATSQRQAQNRIIYAIGIAEPVESLKSKLYNLRDRLTAYTNTSNEIFKKFYEPIFNEKKESNLKSEGDLLVAKQYELEIRELLRQIQLESKNLSEASFFSIYHQRHWPMVVGLFPIFIFFSFLLILGFSLLRKIRRSIENLIRATDSVVLGNFSYRAPISSSDEFGKLTAAFNHMLDRLDEGQRRLSFLASMSSVLTRSFDIYRMVNELSLAVVRTMADWCVIDLKQSDQSLKRVAAAHSNPEMKAKINELVKLFPTVRGAESGSYHVAMTGESRLTSVVTQEFLREACPDESYLGLVKRLSPESVICVPIVASGVVLGTITIVSTDPNRRYTQADLLMTEEVGKRTGLAIENARLFLAESEARERVEEAVDRTERLQGITAAFSEALGQKEVCHVVISQGLTALGADRGAVALLSKDSSHYEIQDHFGYTEELLSLFKRISLDDPYPASDAMKMKQAIWMDKTEDCLKKYPNMAGSQTPRFGAFAVIPLQVEGEAIGVIWIVFNKEKKFQRPEKEFLLALASQCAQALFRAQLYDQAQEAIRVRDEFLSIASHELKTPLTPLKIQVQMISRLVEQGKLQTVPPEQIDDLMKTANSQVNRLKRLVDELLDVSRIGSSELRLLKEEVNLSTLVRDTIEWVKKDYPKVDCALYLAADVVGFWDRTRLEQVILNLISNAAKYGRNQTVDLHVWREGDMAFLSVSDRGIGISTDDQKRIFNRFERAVPAANFGGLGLGLYVAQQVIVQHGGTIQVKSEVDKGSTFLIKLPIEAAPRYQSA